MKASVVKKAVLSEKAYKLMEKGIYTFFVLDSATKKQVANNVSSQFETKVKKVNFINVPKKEKRVKMSRKTVLTGGGKKAIVYLEKGQSIALLSPKSETSKKKKEQKKEK